MEAGGFPQQLARGHNGHQPTHVDCIHGVIRRSMYPDLIKVNFMKIDI